MTRQRAIILLAGLLSIAAIAVVALNVSRKRTEVVQKQTDERNDRIVYEVKSHVRQYLANLPDDDEIIQLYGELTGLSFGTYRSRKASRGLVRVQGMLVIECVAEFERCNNDLTIAVWWGESLHARTTLAPDIRKGSRESRHWGNYYSEVHESLLYVVSEDGKMRSTPRITIIVTHPDFKGD